MEKKYDHQKIEKKWQKSWEKEGFNKAEDFSLKKKYILDMFPYPSGAGLHVGHVEGYTATDIYSRFLRMRGCNVLHPMGWDAFGLPTENYAIKQNRHPKEITKENTDNFRKQCKMMGFSYDWSREINTSEPTYYKWTQWLFLQLYKRGLAYKKNAPVNWCESCKTVLAREQVIEGKCERCKNQVMQKMMKQWFFKITDYAERLLLDLDKVDWPENIKEMQKNWIGKSSGAEIEFEVINERGKTGQKVKVFTTRPDTLFGATYLVLAPEHLIIQNLKDEIQNYPAVEKYIQQTQKKNELQRTDLAKEKTGVEIKGLQAVNAATGKVIPIWIADYVLMNYGAGAIMAVPAHDSRDFEFAKKYKLPIQTVIEGEKDQKGVYEGEGKLVYSGEFNGLKTENAKQAITKKFGKPSVQYKLRDWLISRQRYWGAPIPIIYCEKCGEIAVSEKDLPVELPNDVDFKPTGESPLKSSKKFNQVKCPKCGKKAERESDTMDTFVCSAWYYLRFLDPKNKNKFCDSKKIKYWMPVDLYIGGAEHAVLHLLYARFVYKVLYDAKFVPEEKGDEPFRKLRNQGLILAEDGRKMSKSLGNVVSPDEVVQKYGADTMRLFEMFMGPLKDAKPWDTKAILGMQRFLERVWLVVNQIIKDKNILKDISGQSSLIHPTVQKVTSDIKKLKFNTAIASLMIQFNGKAGQPDWRGAFKKEKWTKQITDWNALEKFLLLLSPFAPHLAEELWQRLGHKKSIFLAEWPKYSLVKVEKTEVDLIIQINGKLRDLVKVEKGLTEAEVKKIVLGREKVQKWIENQEIKKIIFVADRLVNLVV